MKFGRIMLITLLLAVLTIGAVSAADDVDALTVDDAGNETVVEAPVDDASLEAGENEDSLEADNDVIVINDEISSESDEVCQVKDSSYVYGTISVFANDTHVASKYCGGGYKTEKILAKKMMGSFSGTYNIKIVYHNLNDGADYSNEGLVTFKTPISNEGISPEEFNFTLVRSEVTINDDDAVIFSYQWPDGTSQWDNIGIGLNNESDRNFNKGSETSRNITLGDLYIFEQGTFDFIANYYDSDNYMTKIADGTFKVTKVYTANDFMELYTKTITDPTDYVCNVYDSDAGLVGEVTVLANNSQVYYKRFTDISNTAVRINGNNLTGDLKGTYNVKVIYKRGADGKEYSKSATITFGSSEPADTRPWVTFKPTADDITYGQNAVVNVAAYDDYNSMDNTVSCNVLVELLYFDGIKYVTVASSNAVLTNGVGSATFSNLDAAEYLVSLDANDTEAYKANPNSGSLTVKKALSRILFYDSVVEIGAGAPYNLTVDFEKAAGITAKVDGENVTVYGNLVCIPALSFGNHTLEISTIPDDNHIEDSKEITLNVTKPRSSIVMDKQITIFEGSSADVTVTTRDALGFNASIEGHPEALNVNGNVITISGLNAGTYTLSVTTLVDDDHVAVTEKATITVKRRTADIVFSNESLVYDYGSSGSIIADVSNGTIAKAIVIAHSEAIIKIDGNKITVSNLTVGNYTLSVTSKPIQGYSAVIKSVKVIVNPVADVKEDSSVNVGDVVMDYGSSKNVVVVTTGATGFTARIDGNDVVVNGNSVVVSGLETGTHILSITTIPDATHNAVTKNVTITVKPLQVSKLATAVSASKVTVTYGTSKNIVVTLKDANNVPLKRQKVTVTINGKPYSGNTNDNGQASIAVPKNLAVKTYKSTITFAGDDKYKNSTGSVNVVVIKATPKLTAKAKTFKKSVKIKKYVVTLKTNQNKVMKNTKVYIKVNGKTYAAKTNSKGQATFKITKLTKKGKHPATITYKGNTYYNKLTKKVKITIK